MFVTLLGAINAQKPEACFLGASPQLSIGDEVTFFSYQSVDHTQ